MGAEVTLLTFVISCPLVVLEIHVCSKHVCFHYSSVRTCHCAVSQVVIELRSDPIKGGKTKPSGGKGQCVHGMTTRKKKRI